MFSSKYRAFVELTDEEFVNWLDNGFIVSTASAEDLIDCLNQDIVAQIKELEAKTLRSIRDIHLGNGEIVDDEGKTPIVRLQDIEAEISDLRENLITEI